MGALLSSPLTRILPLYVCMCTSVGVPKEASDGHEIPLPDMGAGNQTLALGRSSKCSSVIKSSLQPLSVIWMSFSHQLCISCVPVRFWFHTKKPPNPGPLAPVSFCCCDKDQDPKQRGEERVGPSSSSQVHHWGSQGRDHCGVYGVLWLALFAFLLLPGPRNHRSHCPQWAEPFHINHQEMPHIFSVEIPSQVTSAVSSGHKTWPAHPSGFSLFVLAQTLLTPG